MFAIFAILSFLSFTFADWIIAYVWVKIEVFYCRKNNIKDYKPDIKERREIIKKDMIEKAEKYWR